MRGRAGGDLSPLTAEERVVQIVNEVGECSWRSIVDELWDLQAGAISSACTDAVRKGRIERPSAGRYRAVTP